jgi:hypothetical protein
LAIHVTLPSKSCNDWVTESSACAVTIAWHMSNKD